MLPFRSMRRWGLLAIAVCAVLLITCNIGHVQAASCAPAPTFVNGDQVNIAVMVWLIDQPYGVFTGKISQTIPETGLNYGAILQHPATLALEMYMDKMAEIGYLLPLPSGEKVKMNFVVINLAGPNGSPLAANYSILLPSGYPTFMATTSYLALTSVAGGGTGMIDNILSQDPVVLQANFGITQPFTYVIPPYLMIDPFTQMLMAKIEDAQSHVVLHPFVASRGMFVCDDTKPDCVARGRKGGARRYKTMFTTLFDSTANQYAALDLFHTLGVKTIAVFWETELEFPIYAAQLTVEGADQLNIVTAVNIPLPINLDCDPVSTATKPVNCPPADAYKAGQTRVFNDNVTPAQVAQRLQDANVEAIIFLGSSGTAAGWSIGQLYLEMKKIGYSPKATSWGGGMSTGMLPWMDDPTNLDHIWTTLPWDPKLKGPIYKNKGSASEFELLPANATHDGPQVFWDAFQARYGPGSHPITETNPTGISFHYIPGLASNSAPAIYWGGLIQVQKLIEHSATLDVPSILAAAPSISTPGQYHQVQFDQYGRTARVNEIQLQTPPAPADSKLAAKPIVLSPYNIGEAPVYPAPTWEERVFDPQFYQLGNEKLMVALNTVCIFACLLLMVMVAINYKTPVIRAATPVFCLMIIAGGIMMLISNYFTTTVVNDAHCAASVWFLTLGFTTVFASMFIKTFRIWKIFHKKKLQVTKIKNTTLVLSVAGFLLVDIVINAAWAGAGLMKSTVVVVDQYRPFYNYTVCDFNDAAGAIYAHIAVKAFILFCGVILTYAVRATPSSFNESTLIGLSIYNVSFVVCFILPIVAADLGGRHTVYLIRTFSIMFVVISTMGLMYVPKLINIRAGNNVNPLNEMTREATGTATPGNQTHAFSVASDQALGQPQASNPSHKSRENNKSRGASVGVHPVTTNTDEGDMTVTIHNGTAPGTPVSIPAANRAGQTDSPLVLRAPAVKYTTNTISEEGPSDL